MTTAASFTSLQAPLAEDSMEMSSPAQPVYDDDIEIDFDEHIGGVELTDDERMADDTEQQRPGTATDDMMEDDAPSHDVEAPEQEMQDDFDAIAYEQAEPDDELIDYGEDDYQDMTEGNDQSTFEPPAPEITLEDRESTDPDFEQVDEEIVREPETSVPVPEVVVAEEAVPETVPAAPDTNATEASEVSHVEAPSTEALPAEAPPTDALDNSTDEQAVVPEENAASAVATNVDDEHNEDDNPATPHEVEPFPELPEDSPELKDPASLPAPLDTNVDASIEAPGTPTDTGLHPMVIQYGDWEWPLFKSRRQPEGLLKDDNLASVALADLLNNCRSRLALKVGEETSEEQEFVLRFDSTGLTIVENSPTAFNTSLEEILDVFKQLHVNDGAQSIPPFWLFLSLQPKPSSYLTMLKQAAAGGQGISSFIDIPTEEVPADFGEYYQDGDEDPTLLGDGSGIAYDDQAHNEGQAVSADANEADYHEYDTSHENTEGGQEAQEENEQYEQYDEAEQAGYEDHEAGEDTNTTGAQVYAPDVAQGSEEPAISHGADVEDAPVAANNETDDGVAAIAPEADGRDVIETAESEAEEPEEASNVESVASSATLRADQANDAVGEYKDEDFINWDNSTLTTNFSEHDTDDNGRHDFSTFLAEPDVANTGSQASAGGDVLDEVIRSNTEASDQTDGAPAVESVNSVSHEDALRPVDIGVKVNGASPPHAVAAEPEEPSEAAEIATGKSVNAGAVQSQPVSEAAASPSETQAQAQMPENDDTVVNSDNQVQDAAVKQSTCNDEDYIDFGDEDDIDFDDDTYEQHEARKASLANSSGSRSPSTKRPLDETEGIDFSEQPDLKKVKSS